MTTQQWILGRAEDCHGTINDEYASPHHCRVTQDDQGRVFVEDLGSTNGTYIHRGRLKLKVPLGTRAPLVPGDRLVVGRTEIPWTAEP